MNLTELHKVIEQLKTATVEDFQQFVDEYSKNKVDKSRALMELDGMIATAQNNIMLLSLFLKQTLLISKGHIKSSNDNGYYTKQELANKYKVSVRTITNWVIDGLEMEEVGGIKRISAEALERFKRTVKGKKFSWRSVKR